MAIISKRSHPWLSRLHFLVRFLGLTGLLALLVAAVMAHEQGMFRFDAETWRRQAESGYQRLQDAVEGRAGGTRLEQATLYLILGGAATAALWLVVDGLTMLRLAAARRSAFGANALVQAALVAALVGGVNVYSFLHYQRVDLTRDGEFTLPARVREDLARLRGETTIVVLQQRPEVSESGEELADYAAAAEAVVVEKVRDLANRLREFGGAELNVVLLDARDKEYRTHLAAVTENKQKLAEAIRTAPGSSIIFYAEDEGKKSEKKTAHVRRISFDDFYQLDRTASRQADGGKGNLVLLDKGIEPLTRRILNLEGGKPRVGVLVVHDVFASESDHRYYGMRGLKKSLERHGFEVRDIVLKRDIHHNRRTGQIQWRPAGRTLREIDYERWRDDTELIPEQLRELTGVIDEETAFKREWEDSSLEELTRKYARRIGIVRVTEEHREAQVNFLEGRIAALDRARKRLDETLSKARQELESVNADVMEEWRRMSDLRAKLERFVADCDLLLIPRMPLHQDGEPFPDQAGLYRLEDFQVAVIKDFLKDGKPVLACLGAAVEARLPFAPPLSAEKDGLEELFTDLRIVPGKTTVVYEAQSAEYTERRADPFLTREAEVPPLDLTTPRQRLVRPGDPGAEKPNPLRESLRLTDAARGGGLDLRLRYPRPIYYNARHEGRLHAVAQALAATPLNPLTAVTPRPPASAPLPVAPEFLWTAADSWNDDQPFPTPERPVPRYEKPAADDPGVGTLDEERRGPFPVGVAVETRLPEHWYDSLAAEPATARVVVIGHAGMFVGPELDAASEKLLLDTCNWLLGRDDLLTRETARWSYPRLSLNGRDKALWLWGASVGLPALFAYLGLVVLMARRVQ